MGRSMRMYFFTMKTKKKRHSEIIIVLRLGIATFDHDGGLDEGAGFEVPDADGVAHAATRTPSGEPLRLQPAASGLAHALCGPAHAACGPVHAPRALRLAARPAPRAPSSGTLSYVITIKQLHDAVSLLTKFESCIKTNIFFKFVKQMTCMFT